MKRFFVYFCGMVALAEWIWSSKYNKWVIGPLYWKQTQPIGPTQSRTAVPVFGYFSGFIASSLHHWSTGKGRRRTA